MAGLFNDFEPKLSDPKGPQWDHDAERPFLTDSDTVAYLEEKAK